MITAEWFPQAYAMGVSWDEFWHMNPRILAAIADGYKQRIRHADYMNWLNGHYILSAVAVAVERNLAGKKAKLEYDKKPILEQVEEENKPMSEEELHKQRVLFMEKLKIMQANFELAHPKKAKGGESEKCRK